MDPKSLAGSVKAAILVNAMGREASQVIRSRLSDEQNKLVEKLTSQMGGVPPSLVENVAREFMEKAGHSVGPGVPAAAKSESESAVVKEESKHLTALRALDADQLFRIIADEHPQTIAIIIAHLDAAMASEVLGNLQDDLKADVAYRIATLDKVVSGMLEEIENVFRDVLMNKGDSVAKEAGGLSQLAIILNQIDGPSADLIFDEIDEIDPDLADQIRQMMFVFDDLVLVDDKGLQKVLRSVETQELAIALKAASEEVKQKIFRNMSERASEILKEELDATGSVRMKEVTDAQQNITKIVQDMERKGEVIISGRGGEEFIG